MRRDRVIAQNCVPALEEIAQTEDGEEGEKRERRDQRR
jgi:hypothetical protein